MNFFDLHSTILLLKVLIAGFTKLRNYLQKHLKINFHTFYILNSPPQSRGCSKTRCQGQHLSHILSF
ncbi:MAG: hypothetical protein D6813_07090 [Calditrichaeota bacterium]|nr:MAG: hypothetical protein D6813_07090 [Calditrichota bacterium]